MLFSCSSFRLAHAVNSIAPTYPNNLHKTLRGDFATLTVSSLSIFYFQTEKRYDVLTYLHKFVMRLSEKDLAGSQ